MAQLTALVPTTPYLLIYSIPLLVFSLVLTFTGTFLTLDRSRTFPSAHHGVYAPQKSKLNWPLEGGIGGLIGGFLFAVHLSTALSLLIPSTTAAAALSYKSFLAVWILSAIPTIALAGRYRYLAYSFFSLSGGCSISLALCVILHPSLQPRIILTITFLILFFVLSLIFSTIPRLNNLVFHTFLRVCTASAGSFGIIQSIALLLLPQEKSWSNIWERLWLKDGIDWGTSREHGLSAGYCVFFLIGFTSDWALHRWIGECPDEKWDNYLAHYTANLANLPNRAGTFQPFNSFWDRWFFHASSSIKPPFDLPSSKETELSPDFDIKTRLSSPFSTGDVWTGKLSEVHEKDIDVENQTLLSVSKGKNYAGPTTRGRKPVKFGYSSESESDDDDDEPTKKGTDTHGSIAASDTAISRKDHKFPTDPPPRPRLFPTRTASSSTPTLVERGSGKGTQSAAMDSLAVLDYEKEIKVVKDKLRRNGVAGPGEEVEYSDYEEDVISPTKKHEGNSPWIPAFLSQSQGKRSSKPDRLVAQPNSQVAKIPLLNSAMPVSVAATPSLIKAIDRINLAQRDAFGRRGFGLKTERVEEEAESDAVNRNTRTVEWEQFWKDVKANESL